MQELQQWCCTSAAGYKLPGLMFADDIVNRPEELQIALNKLEAYCSHTDPTTVTLAAHIMQH